MAAAGAGVLTALTGVVSAVVVAGPFAGIVAGTVMPDNAAWQGYTATFVDKNKNYYATKYFYGWKEANNIFHAVSVDGEYDANKFPNFADENSKFVWYTWKSDDAPIREGK